MKKPKKCFSNISFNFLRSLSLCLHEWMQLKWRELYDFLVDLIIVYVFGLLIICYDRAYKNCVLCNDGTGQEFLTRPAKNQMSIGHLWLASFWWKRFVRFFFVQARRCIMLCVCHTTPTQKLHRLHVFCQAGPPERVDCLAPKWETALSIFFNCVLPS